MDWAALLDAVQSTRPLHLLTASIVGFIGILLRCWRWRFMVAPIKPVSTARLVPSMMIGALANNVLPARLGELVRAHLLGTAEGISRVSALATIGYERIVDVFAFLLLTGFGMLAVEGPPWLRASAVTVLLLNTALLVAVVMSVRYQQRFQQLVGRLIGALSPAAAKRAESLCESLISGLVSVTDVQALFPVVLGSIAVVSASVGAVFLSMLALNLTALPWHACVTVTLIVSLASMIPAAPGNVGPIQYACVVALAIYGVQRDNALAFSLVYHATQYVPVTLVGVVYLLRQQTGLRSLASHDTLHSQPKNLNSLGRDGE